MTPAAALADGDVLLYTGCDLRTVLTRRRARHLPHGVHRGDRGRPCAACVIA